ncbi:MAG: hypothetical protein K6G27_01450 [Lachnospiraceae bacterium]|nr:hypothetical protein [Lachnospiraceae bacterium]
MRAILSVTAGTVSGGTLKYALSSGGSAPSAGDYKEEIPKATDAGEYLVYYKVEGNPDYTGIDPENITVYIEPKEIVLLWSNTTLSYNGVSQKPAATATGLISADTCNVTVTGAQTNAGTYTATAESVDNTNYRLSSVTTVSYTITKVDMTVTVTGYKGEYDGAGHGITVTVSVPAEATVTYSTTEGGTYTQNNPTFTGPGIYTVYYKAVNDNYKDVTGSETVKIRPVKPAPLDPEHPESRSEYSVDYKNEKIVFSKGYEIRKKTGDSWKDWMDSTNSPIDLVPGAEYQIRKTIKSGDNTVSSDALDFMAASRQDPPVKDNVRTENAKESGNNGSI